MAEIRLIKRRIRSAKNIAQITKAMQMVAASKMKKAQSRALESKPYTDKIYNAVAFFARVTDRSLHKLLSQANVTDKKLIILISTNKGLCGSMNTNLFRKILTDFPQKKNYDFITIGAKGARFVAKNGYTLLADFSEKQPFTGSVPPVINLVVEKYLAGFYQEVFLCYSDFINALNIKPEYKKILPISELPMTQVQESEEILSSYIFEPSTQELLDSLLPHFLETQVRSAIVQAEASEHSSRMLAMKSATDNANSLSDELTMIYNRLRQEQITYEIADITRAQLSFT